MPPTMPPRPFEQLPRHGSVLIEYVRRGEPGTPASTLDVRLPDCSPLIADEHVFGILSSALTIFLRSRRRDAAEAYRMLAAAEDELNGKTTPPDRGRAR